VRGKDCVWRGGFARGLGDCDVIVAELWGVLEGLNYVRRLSFRRIELHSDSR
jgi:ribonuclease HI